MADGKKIPISLVMLVEELHRDDEQYERFKLNPLPQLALLAARESRSLHSDTFIYRSVVVMLGAVVLAVTGFVCWKYFSWNQPDKEVPVPSFLVALGSTALGALAGLLSPIPITKGRGDA